MQPLARSRSATGQPVLHRRVHVLVTMVQRQRASRGRHVHLSERAAHFGVLGRRDEPGGPQSLYMPEAAQHVPGKEASIPGAIVSSGVLEETLVRCGRAPERGCPVHGFLLSGEVGAHQLAIEGARGGYLRYVYILVCRVRPAAGAGPAFDRVTITEEHPIGARRTSEMCG